MNMSWALSTRECGGPTLSSGHTHDAEFCIELRRLVFGEDTGELRVCDQGMAHATWSTLGDLKHLDLSKPLDAAVYACLTTAFYALCRLGELTVKALKSFEHDFVVTKIFLPRTKTSNVGQSVFWAQQDNPFRVETYERNETFNSDGVCGLEEHWSTCCAASLSMSSNPWGDGRARHSQSICANTH